METSLEKHDQVKLAQGDERAWRLFLGQEIPKLYAMFIRRWANRSLAEELVQKTIFDAIEHKDSFDINKGSFQGWLWTIARNNISMEMRKRSAVSIDDPVNNYIEKIDSELLPDEILEKKETAELVTAAMKKLDEKYQLVLRAKYIDNDSVRNISKQMKITEKAVHSLLYRARIALATELKKSSSSKSLEQKV